MNISSMFMSHQLGLKLINGNGFKGVIPLACSAAMT